MAEAAPAAGCAQPAPHVPRRMCAVCRARRPKAELERHVRAAGPQAPATDHGRAPAGYVCDPDQRLPGRGVYVCREPSCRQAFVRYGARRKKREE